MTSEPLTEEQAQAVAAVEQFMQVLVKGLRATQLYLPNNPVYLKAMENLRAAITAVWECTSELELGVRETEFVWEEHVVLSQPTKSESVAWLLYKDGVRQLVLQPGVEAEELVRWLNVLNRVRNLPPEAEDDLLTLLWEQDFQFIRYDFVELGMEEVPQLERSEQAPPPPETVRQQVVEEVPEEEAPQRRVLVDMDDFDSTLYFLDQHEIAYLESEIQREYQQDLRANVLSMVFDLLELQPYATVRAELLSILDNFIPYLLAVGDFRSVAYILREVRVVLQRARELIPEHRAVLEGLPGKLSQAESLGQLLQALDEAVVHPTDEELGELFRELRPEALEVLFGWLPRLANERVRQLLGAAVQRLCQAHPDEVARVLKTGEAPVLLEAIKLAAQLKLPPLVPALGSLLQHADVEVRRRAAEALAAMGTPGAMKQLEGALGDRDREVRVTAIRAMGRTGYRGAFSAIEAMVHGKAVQDADLTERTAVFETFGVLAGEAGVETLAAMLRSGGFLRRKLDPELRACAAMALGKIRTAAALELLRSAANDKDPLVRNAVSRALKEAVS